MFIFFESDCFTWLGFYFGFVIICECFAKKIEMIPFNRQHDRCTIWRLLGTTLWLRATTNSVIEDSNSILTWKFNEFYSPILILCQMIGARQSQNFRIRSISFSRSAAIFLRSSTSLWRASLSFSVSILSFDERAMRKKI